MSTLFFRLVLFILLILTSVSGLLWLSAVLLLWYVWLYLGVEVIFVAMFIDAYFGYTGKYTFVYTITVALIVLVVSLVQPLVTSRNQPDSS